MSYALSRRRLLATMGPVLLSSRLSASEHPMRGVFIIMATPYTAAKAVDFEDLALGQGDEPLANLSDGLRVAEAPY